jgi:hypothetical protein
MVSKVRERIYAESAAKLLGVDWIFGEIAEPLDFEVRSGHDVFGLEVPVQADQLPSKVVKHKKGSYPLPFVLQQLSLVITSFSS